jgi:hypothetical protein
MHNPINKKDLEHMVTLLGPTAGAELTKLINREPTYTFMAYLTQYNTDAPIVDILYSNLETNPVSTYGTTGIYVLEHPLFDFNNTVVIINKDQCTSGNYAGAFVKMAGQIFITCYDNAFTSTDNALYITPIKIQIWDKPTTVPLI